MSEDVPPYGPRKFKIGDRVRLKSSGQRVKTVPTIIELLAGGYVMLLWVEDDGRRLNSSCHVRELELVSDGDGAAAIDQ